jgi:hypothetical protein
MSAVLLAPRAFAPVVNLVAPLRAGLAFAGLCLDELAALRPRDARATPGMLEGKATA